MKSAEDIKRYFRQATLSTNPDKHEAVFEKIRRAQEQSRTIGPASHRSQFGSNIMKSPVIKLAAAAIVVGVLSLFVGSLLNTTTAYALEQTIEANQHLHFLHMKTFVAGHDEPKEFWLECDQSGQIKNARWHMPEWDAPEDGAKVVVWSADTIRIWFKKKSCVSTFTRQAPPLWLLDFALKSDPRLSIAQLKDEQARGQVELEIQEPADKTQPIVVTATYPAQDQSAGRRIILRVNQATKLVTSRELFILKEGSYVLDCRQEFTDYNNAADPALFNLDALVPADVRRVDGDAIENRGLPQGTLSDEEIAVEVVRQFFEAMIAGNYEKASQLFCGVPVEELRDGLGGMRILRIVSIGEPTPHPTNPEFGGLRVPCKIEIEKDGVRSIWEPFGPFVRTIHRQSEHPRWEIHGGI